MNLKKEILLTGAGFTANFGGFLGREMWAKILNNPKLEELTEIRKLLLSDFDFENIYSNVTRSDNFSAEIKQEFQDIVEETYKNLDDAIRIFISSNTDNLHYTRKLLRAFSGSQKDIGCHFTLNQDLFMERMFGRQPLAIKDSPGIGLEGGAIDQHYKVLFKAKELKIFKKTELESWGDLYYVKLHGSYGWLSSDGTPQMVLGKNKEEDIRKEPLLAWYIDLFKRAVCRDGVKILIIGYGFLDEHINKMLFDGVTDNNLKLYIVSPEDPQRLKKRLKDMPIQLRGTSDESGFERIWKNIYGYFQYRMKDIFPPKQIKTRTAYEIAKIFSFSI